MIFIHLKTGESLTMDSQHTVSEMDPSGAVMYFFTAPDISQPKVRQLVYTIPINMITYVENYSGNSPYIPDPTPDYYYQGR